MGTKAHCVDRGALVSAPVRVNVAVGLCAALRPANCVSQSMTNVEQRGLRHIRNCLDIASHLGPGLLISRGRFTANRLRSCPLASPCPTLNKAETHGCPSQQSSSRFASNSAGRFVGSNRPRRFRHYPVPNNADRCGESTQRPCTAREGCAKRDGRWYRVRLRKRPNPNEQDNGRCRAVYGFAHLDSS
jgi:hypothetical protein